MKFFKNSISIGILFLCTPANAAENPTPATTTTPWPPVTVFTVPQNVTQFSAATKDFNIFLGRIKNLEVLPASIIEVAAAYAQNALFAAQQAGQNLSALDLPTLFSTALEEFNKNKEIKINPTKYTQMFSDAIASFITGQQIPENIPLDHLYKPLMTLGNELKHTNALLAESEIFPDDQFFNLLQPKLMNNTYVFTKPGQRALLECLYQDNRELNQDPEKILKSIKTNFNRILRNIMEAQLKNATEQHKKLSLAKLEEDLKESNINELITGKKEGLLAGLNPNEEYINALKPKEQSINSWLKDNKDKIIEYIKTTKKLSYHFLAQYLKIAEQNQATKDRVRGDLTSFIKDIVEGLTELDSAEKDAINENTEKQISLALENWPYTD